ncbi:MAG: FAD-binding oxidoreductase [Deltaproteobacteria bacterium]|nr:FAD-binding oxidoreductase [Deltaproteobacteria bacterium]
MPGRRAPDDDPVDDVLVGLEAVLHDGTPITIRPAPRRAVGPDVLALFRGGEERVGRVARAVLRVRPIRPETKRAYRFADEVAARRALRAMCGLGARPLVHRLSGATLSVCFAELPEIGAAMSTLADEVAALHDGVGIAVVGPVEAVTPQPTWPDVLADWNWSSRNAAIPRG